MPKEKAEKNEIKVTDKRIFTPEGEIREEFRDHVQPAEPQVHVAPQPAPETKQAKASPNNPKEGNSGDKRRTVADRAANPGTPFAMFIESLIVQAYMSLGMLRNPYQPQVKPDAVAARQMIDILNMLEEKTRGNLAPEEEDFLETHLGELKLAFVQKTKSI